MSKQEDDAPIAYLQRVRRYYRALGYGAPYEWAHFDDVPFAPLRKPLRDCRVALVTTAAPYRPEAGDQGPGAPYNAAAKFYAVYSVPSGGDESGDPDLRIAHLAIDRDHTRADDAATWLPLAALRGAASAGRVGDIDPRIHGLPTNRSQRTTLAIDAPELLARCRADAVDVAILVANCPVCHQSTALAARTLEAAGIATVVMGCALDIVEYVGVPRFVFSDFPLGNAAARPHDAASQTSTLDLALDLLDTATAPRTTVQSPLRWSEDAQWKLDYCNIERLSSEEIERRRAEFDAGKAAARRVRERAGS